MNYLKTMIEKTLMRIDTIKAKIVEIRTKIIAKEQRQMDKELKK
jgi:hypothetical protein